VLLAAIWLPWFHRRLSTVFAPVRADRGLSGWRALGGLGGLLAALAVAAVVWGVLRWNGPRPSAVWLVIAGGLALMVEVAVTVARVGAQDTACCAPVVTTTTPSSGLAIAFAGGVVIVLTGLAVLVGETRRRTGTA
jgi:hypothetical protein